MQIHNRMSCAHCNKQNMLSHTITHTIYRTQRIRDMSASPFKKYHRKPKIMQERDRKREANERKNTTMASGYLSFISTSTSSSNNTNNSTIAGTHIINPIQWRFTGEKILHRHSCSHLSFRQMPFSLYFCLILSIFINMQNLFFHPIERSVSRRKKHKTQNIINFINRTEEKYRFDSTVVYIIKLMLQKKMIHSNF